jgi:cytidine deaminase
MSEQQQLLDKLKEHATRAAGHAYAPYSRFPVGAAVLGTGGRIYTGCNVENASFSLTQCAERAALAAAICDGAKPGAIAGLVIYTPGLRAHPPCGACRQVMHELMAPGSLVATCCDGEATRIWPGTEYLPEPFTPEALKQATETD